MRTRYSRHSLLIVAVLTCVAGSLAAQERPRFEGFRGTERETHDVPEQPPAPLPDAEFQQMERDWKEAAGAIEQQSTQLADVSFEAYRRGLMPLPDHLAQLKLAESAELLLISRDDDGVRFLDRKMERLQRVLTALEGIRPAPGWFSETLLVRALLAQARSQKAAVEGDDQLAETEYARALDLAQQHLDRQRRDSIVGFRQGGITRFVNGEIVNDPRFGGWAFFVYAPEAYTELPADVFLQDAVSLLRSWRPQVPDEPGSPNAYIARYQLSRFHLRQSLAAESGDWETAYRDGDEAARQLFALEVELLPSGTALLFDAAIAWELRDELAEILAQHGLEVPAESETGLQTDLERLTQLARFSSDRRGRLEADLTYIELLGTRQRARETLVVLQSPDRSEDAR